MKPVRALSALTILAIWLAAQPTAGGLFSSSDNPSSDKEDAWRSGTMRSSSAKPATPSPLKQFGTGVATGTKKVVSGTVDVLTLRAFVPKKKPASGGPSGPTGYSASPKPKKKEPEKPWYSSLFHREEPKVPRTTGEWLELKRLDP
jgi:hypothetical protein